MTVRKAFTLIELLVVIGIMAVLAAGVVALIDPIDKNRAATDAKVQNDIGQYATALQSYAATHDGAYPTAANFPAALVSSGDLTNSPSAPTMTGYAAYAYTFTSATDVTVCGNLNSKKYTATPMFTWHSNTGKACPAATCTTACP
jgi:prepilin-type N-terminal cleavage/methylation domain-containing protein